MPIFRSLLAAALFAFILPAAAQARWMEARSANFIVFSDGSESSLRQAVTRLEDYDRLLRQITGTTAPPARNPLRIYLVGNAMRLREVMPVPNGVLGFYRARVGGTAAFAVRGDRPTMDGEEILFHEYAHHFMQLYHPAHYPAWYVEGFAEYVMTARITNDRIEVGRFNLGRAMSLVRSVWLPVDQIFSGNLGRLNQERMAQFYAESWLVTHYIFADPGRTAALSRYLADLHRGVAEAQAFRTAFGIDHAAFERDLKRYRDGQLGYAVLNRPASAPPEIGIRLLSTAAYDLMLPHAALMLGVPDEREAELLAEIRQAAARFPDDPFAQKVLARAEIGSGDRAAGVAIVDRLLQASPGDAELLYLRGVADFYTGRRDPARRAERFAAARPWFVRAVSADHGYYTALYRLAQCSPDADEQTLDTLVAAHSLAPLVGDIAVDTATALIARRRYAEAERVILPIATNPHGGNAERARALLAEARAGTP